MKLVIIRHGFSQANAEHRCVGITDVPLAEEGIEKLKELKEKYRYEDTDFYYSSPLLRARQTFEILFPDKHLDGLLADFSEQDLGDKEDAPSSEEMSLRMKWYADECDDSVQTYADFEKQVLSGIKKLYDKHANDSVTVVCHAGILRVLLNYLLKNKREAFMTYNVFQGCSFTFELEVKDDELIMLNYHIIGDEPLYKN